MRLLQTIVLTSFNVNCDNRNYNFKGIIDNYDFCLNCAALICTHLIIRNVHCKGFFVFEKRRPVSQGCIYLIKNTFKYIVKYFTFLLFI